METLNTSRGFGQSADSIQFTTANFDVLSNYKYKFKFFYFILATIPEERKTKAFTLHSFFQGYALRKKKSFGIGKAKMNPAFAS